MSPGTIVPTVPPADRRLSGNVSTSWLEGRHEQRQLTPDDALAIRDYLERRLAWWHDPPAAEDAAAEVMILLVGCGVGQVLSVDDFEALCDLANGEATRLSRRDGGLSLDRAGLGDTVPAGGLRYAPLYRDHLEPLRQAVERLSPFDRSLLTDVFFGDRSHRELADKHDLTRGQVRTRIRWALRELKRELGG